MMQFFQKYLIDPMIYGSGYNPVNTVVLGLLFVVVVILVYKALIRIDVKIDKKFIIGVSPFIIFGALLRVFEDAAEVYGWNEVLVGFPLIVTNPATGVVKNLWFITPFVYLISFGVALSFLFISLKLTQKEYYKAWFFSGLVLDLFVLFPLGFYVKNLYGGLLIASIFLLISAIVWFFQKFVKASFENIAVFLSHMFDATTTFVSLQFFGYGEQHVLANLFIKALGPIGMYVLKVPVVLLVLYALDKEKMNINQKNFFKFIILMIALGPGLRNFLRLVLLV